MNTPANRYPLLGLALCAVLLLSAWPADVTSQEVDTVSPVFVSARTDDGYVTITFSEEIFISPLVRYVKEWSGAPLQLFLRAAFDVSINGRVIYTHEWASLSGTDLTLQMAYYAGPGDEVRVAYNNIFVRNAGGLLVDAAGNAVPYFSSQTVQNNAGSPGSNLVDGAVLTPGEITIPEGSSGTYTVKLASQPSENVTVKVMPYAIVQVTPAQLTFTPDNYDAPQTVTVSTYDDTDSIDAWAAVLHQIVGDNNANWTFTKVVVDDQDPPLVVSGNTSTDYAEDGTSAVATYSVADAGGSTVTWTLLGDDKRDFSISRAGVLTFKTPPGYENPADSNGDNVYRVTIHVSNGTSTGALLDVAINITDTEDPNSPATGQPSISGTAQVGETLTASTSGISDADGLTNATFSYQWVSNDGSSDTDISGATSSTYTLVAADEGKTIKVKVSFTDDAGNEETLTGSITVAVVPLTASFEDMPDTHDGSAFTFEVHFSEEIAISYVNVRYDVLEVSGGTVKMARRLNRPSNMSWEIKVKPSSNANVSITLSPTTDCEADDAVCTKGGKALSNSLSATVTGAASKPVACGLDANYPNPFNTETQIAYTLPEAGLVELAIYNVGGQRIRTLVQGVQEVGRYQTVWDGRSDNGAALASGVYLSRLSSPQGMQVRRMLLLR